MPRRLEDYARAVFDCDGVILDSNALKSEMMGCALDGEPAERVAAFVAYHRAHGGVSRYVKFAHFYKEMYPADDPDPAIEAALARYAALLQDGLRACPELPGVRDLLDRLIGAGVACFVDSGGDEDEVRAVLTDRGLAHYFDGIYGSPRTKAENLARIAGIHDGRPGLYLGDARSDLAAAETRGLDFVFVAARSEWAGGPSHCAAHGIPQIATPAEIDLVLPGVGS